MGHSFKHSGARGDIICGLLAIKALGGGVLYIDLEQEIYIGRPMDVPDFERMRDLLITQDYVEDVRMWKKEKIDYDLDKFRNFFSEYLRLTECHLRAFEITDIESLITESWLDVEPLHKADIVINRTPRYNEHLEWHELHEWIDRCIFLGYEEEHSEFVRKTGLDIPLRTPESYLELARIIAGSKLYIGSQSFCWSIAEAMKHPRVLEASRQAASCLPESDNGYLWLDHQLIEAHLDGHGKSQESRNSKQRRWVRPWQFSDGRIRRQIHVKKKLKKIKERPQLSVIFPTAAVDTEMTCHHLDLLCGYTTDAEIIVICNTPDIAAKAEIGKIVTKHENAMLMYADGYCGMGRACNIGAAEAEGDFLFILHDDVKVEPNWHPTMLSKLAEYDEIGQVGVAISTNGVMHVEGWCFGISRRTYEHVGLFDESLSPFKHEDMEFTARLMAHKYKAVQVPNWQVRHIGSKTHPLLDIDDNIKASAERNMKIVMERYVGK